MNNEHDPALKNQTPENLNPIVSPDRSLMQSGEIAAGAASIVKPSIQQKPTVFNPLAKLGAGLGGVGETIGSTASRTGKAALNTAFAVGGIVENSVSHTGKAAIDLAKWVGENTARQTYQWVEQTTQGAGHAVNFIGNNWLTRRLSGVFKLDWLVGVADQVDLNRAAAEVRELQHKHPNESPSQIAHRLMVQKAAFAGGTGLVTSLVPGAALALLAVDLAATTSLQAEMVYQIAAAYGLDLKDTARKGEVLAIFGLALGGGRALKAGLGLMRNVPMAGVIIGVSTNATMTYALGYAACRFYEAKQQGSTSMPVAETLEALTQESDQYLEVAIAQQAVMDQIMVHMIVASYPNQDWEQILPNLAALQLSPASLAAIAASLKSPKPLPEFLDQLNRDYAVPLLALCYRISLIDQERSPAETTVLEAISNKFGIELENIKQMVAGNLL